MSQHKLELADFWFSKKGKYFERILADMGEANFGDEMFDVVYSIASIMYCKDISTTFREINRILKPGGKVLILCEPRVAFYQTGDACKRRGSGSAYTTFEWYAYLKHSGFKVIKEYFAESVRMRFRDPEIITKKDKWYYIAAKLLSPIWKVKFVKNIKIDKLTLIYSIFMPLPLTIVAIKEKQVQRWK